MQFGLATLTNVEFEQPHLVLIGDGISFKAELCQMIEQQQMFDHFSKPEIECISEYVKAYKIDAYETIFKEGDEGSFMGIVIKGRVDIIKIDKTGNSKHITMISPGKSMGEMSLVDNLPYSATAIAIETTKILAFTRVSFERLLQKHPVIGVKILRKIAQLMSQRLRQTTGTLLNYLE
jgi:CRP/FNR family cyclic AMP-dependent transcriptional regulator